MQVSPKKYHINLLQPELLPDKVLLTLPRVVALWGVVLLVMIAWGSYNDFTQEKLSAKLQVLKQEESRQSNQLNQLTKQLSSRKVNSQLTEKLEVVKLLVKNKQTLHAKLTDSEQTHVVGFADAMKELSQLHRNDIRLQNIHINNDHMTFKGLAIKPEAVPAWLSGFENSLLLSGKSFSHFKLSENEENITEFMVSSRTLGESSYE